MSAILRVASELLAQRGCSRFTMEEVARRLRMSKATLYSHFRSRTDLISAVLRGAAERVAEAMAEAGSSPDPGDEAIRVLAHRCLLIAEDAAQELPVPCCLREIECPYEAWGRIEGLFRRMGNDREDLLSEGEVLRLLCAALAAELRRGGRRATDRETQRIMAYLDRS